jgi:subtilisin family serine protease
VQKILRGAVICAAIFAAATSAQAQAANDNPVEINTRAAESAGKQAAVSALTEKAQRNGRIRVIIGLNVQLEDEDRISRAQAETQTRRLQSAQSAVSQRSSLSTADVVRFNYIPSMSAFVTAAQLQRLLNDPDVVSIVEDVPSRPMLQDSIPLTRTNRAWQRGFTGQGQVVAILDSGVDDLHPMLRNKVVAGLCRSTTSASSTSLCPNGMAASNNIRSGRACDDTIFGCDHGTHVASIAVGKSPNLRGVARNAKFIAAQVFSRFEDPDCGPAPSPCALSWNTDQIAALERVFQLRNSFTIASVNMSLGGGSHDVACDGDPRASIITRLYRAGIATVIASGNNGFDGFISAPACITKAVAVGSTNKNDRLSSFSNHSALVDILAPGGNIRAAGLDDPYVIKSGTSMATPHVAGAYAVLRQAKPDATVNQILGALRQTGKSVTRGGVTKRRIDVGAAADMLDPP